MFRSLDRMAPEKVEMIRADSARFLDQVVPETEGSLT